jgi:3-oxoadipate enol-lactonase
VSALGDMLTPAHRLVGEAPETLLYLHGIGGDRTSFDGQIGARPPAFRHLAWDMPGYGDSASLTEMTFPALARAAVRLLDEVGAARAHIVGHSFGGMVAQEVACAFPDRVASLALYATSAAFGGPGGDFQRRFLDARLAPLDRGLGPADFAQDLVAGMVGKDPDAAGVAAAVATMARVPAETYRAALHCLVGFDRRADLAAIRAPTLLIAGARDVVAPAEVMARMARRIEGARLATIDGAGHLAHLERPVEFNAVLSDFLESLAAARGGDDHGLRAQR